jgi:hypothetical protein
VRFRTFCLLCENVKIKVNRTVILPVILKGFETLYFVLKEEQRLKVFENRVPGRIFGPTRNEVTGDWRKLHDEELHNFYSSPHIIKVIRSRRMRSAGNVARMGGKLYMLTKFRLESLKGRDHLEDIGVDGRMNNEMDVRDIGFVGCGLGSSGSE